MKDKKEAFMERISNMEIQQFEIQHIAAVREAAAECTVLLKNEGILPLKGTGKIALYGSGARRTIKGGTGSGDVNVRHFVTIEEGLENAGFEITSKDWLDSYEDIMNRTCSAWIQEMKRQAKEYNVNPVMYAMGKAMPEPEYEFPLDAEGDTALYVLSRNSGEGADRAAVAGDINLTGTEIRDILALNQKYKNFVLILNVGGMVNLAPVAEVKSVLLLGQLGTPTGDVCADLLLGKSYPSGKLAMTWAPINAYPSTEGFGDMNDTRYQEGIYVGYRYFDTVGLKPTYAFGYGIGYTDFQINTSGFQADAEKVSVTAIVENTGNFAGKEVVQVYYSAPAKALDKPFQELAAFAKTRELAPGEKQELTLTFALTDMASYDEEKSAYVLEQGDYLIRVGSCSDNTVVCGVVRLDQSVITYQAKAICPGWDFEDIKPNAGRKSNENTVSGSGDASDLKVITIHGSDIRTLSASYRNEPKELEKAPAVSWQEVKAGKKSVDEFLAGLTVEQTASLCVGNYSEGDMQSVIGSACVKVAGGAGETTRHLDALGLDTLSMADGPAGLRLSKGYKLVGGAAKSSDSALDGVFRDLMDTEQMKMMAAMMPQPSEEELNATVYYQYCIAIPIGTGLAQSFNTELCESCGDIVGEEMEMFGVNLWLAPALNIQRSPLCGRNFEYYSEDPLISGKIAAAITRGVQRHKGCGTTIKHYAANNQETNRYASNSILSERTLREIYLRGFEICVKESAPEAVMTSYNLINGEHTCNSYDLLTSVLRDEWGYEGVVMTDWYVTSDMMRGQASIHPFGSAAGCVKAGNHLCMAGTESDVEDILKALEDENHPYHLTKARLQDTAKVVLKSVLRLAV